MVVPALWSSSADPPGAGPPPNGSGAGGRSALHIGGGGSRQTTHAPLRLPSTRNLPVLLEEPGHIPVTDALLPWIRWMDQAGL